MKMTSFRALLALTTAFSGCAASGAVQMVDPHAVYPEGPLWVNDQLFYVEYGGAGVKRWDGGKVAVYWDAPDCGPSGLSGYAHGHLLIACYDANKLVELDAQAKPVRVIDRDQAGRVFVGPNDFATDSSGGVYFSASGVYDLAAPITGAVLYLSRDGARPAVVADTIHYSNGLTISKDGRHLLVAEGLAGRILSFPINSNGTLGARSVWARLRDLAAPTAGEDAYNGPDGLKLGPDGNYYIAQNGSGRVLVVSEDKKLIRTIDVPTPYVTNVNFGPHGTVFVTGVFDQFKTPFPGVVYQWTP